MGGGERFTPTYGGIGNCFVILLRVIMNQSILDLKTKACSYQNNGSGSV